LIEIAAELGVTQHVLENEYYMIDLPQVLESHRKQKASQNYMNAIITMIPSMEPKAREKAFRELERQAGITQYRQAKLAKFDHAQFNKIKAMMGQL